MTSEQLLEMLRRADVEQPNDMQTLALAVRNQSRELTRTLVREWVSPDSVMSRKAALVLSLCEELGIAPLIDSRDSMNPTQQQWRLTTAVESELRLRQRILDRLDWLFDDRSLIPLPDLQGSMEEPVVQRRVCDDAYLLMRRMLNPQEGPLQSSMNARAFLALSSKEKDAEIEKARRGHTWSKFVEDVEE